MTELPFGIAPGFDRRLAWLALAGAVLGSVALVLECVLGHGEAALGALAASWLCLAGVATGALAFSATIRLTGGRWAGAVLPIADAAARFLLPTLAILVVLLLTAQVWTPGLAERGLAAQGWIGARNLAATLALVIAGRRYVKQPDGRACVAYLLLFAVTLSVWAADFVLGLRGWAPSTIVPPYVFIGAYLGGIAWVTLMGTLRASGPAADARHDLGKLLFGFAVFTAYLLWAAFLPVWYANLPDETGLLFARWSGGWRVHSLAVAATVFVLPVVLLLPERTKRARTTLAIAGASVLAGLLGERFLLVLPSLGHSVDAWTFITGASAAMATIGVFVLTIGAPVTPAQAGYPAASKSASTLGSEPR